MSKTETFAPGSTLIRRYRSKIRRIFAGTHGDTAQANRLVLLGWLALFGYPLYYWVWAYLFPQPYENATLRLVGIAWAVPFFFAKRLLREKWFTTYFFLAIAYIFPLFFTFMFLMNGGSTVWAQSLLIAVIILFHFDGKFASASFVLGTSLAYLAYALTTGKWDWPQPDVLTSVPIVAFAILSISIVKIGRSMLVEEKLHGMASALGIVSHELRTPLRSVDASARGLQRYLPALVELVKTHQDSTAEALSINRVQMIEPAIQRIQAEVRYMNSSIDLLLANTADTRRSVRTTTTISIRALVSTALERYPFESPAQRALVHVDFLSDYTIVGNWDLGMLVVLNLLKNALHAIARSGKGEVFIATSSPAGGHHLIVRDTACGIAPRELRHIFRRFYSYPPGAGTGIGLAFVRDTLNAWGATITCQSNENEFTQFVIQFPSAPGATALPS